MKGGKIAAIVMIVGLLISSFGRYFWYTLFIILGIVLLLFIIRLLADLFWWGKDNGKW